MSTESDHMYIRVPESARAEYDRLMVSADLGALCQETIQGMASVMPYIEWVIVRQAGKDHEVDLSILKSFYRYGFEGDPALLLHDDGSGTFMYEQYLGIRAYNWLGGAFVGETGDEGFSVGSLLVLNATAARAKLDFFRLTGEGYGDFTFHDLAMLARMRDRSVRNCATPHSKTPLKTFKRPESNTTWIHHEEGLRWLQGRRRYCPTRFPESQAEREIIIGAIENFF